MQAPQSRLQSWQHYGRLLITVLDLDFLIRGKPKSVGHLPAAQVFNTSLSFICVSTLIGAYIMVLY